MRRTEHHTHEGPESTRGDVEVINAQSSLGGTEPHTEPENIHAHATMHVDSHTDSSSEETIGDTHMHAQPNSDTSSEESEPLLTHIPRGQMPPHSMYLRYGRGGRQKSGLGGRPSWGHTKPAGYSTWT